MLSLIMLIAGSCAVEYTLHLTPQGRQKYLSQEYRDPSSNSPTSSFSIFNIFSRFKEIATSIINYAIQNPLLLVFIWLNYRILRWIIYSVILWLFPRTERATNRPRQPRRPFWSGFFGDGGYDPPGPPPPYTRHPPPSSRKTYQVTPETQGWTPGFWSGLAGGAALGYGLGSRRSDSETTQQQQRYGGTRSSTGYTAPSASSGWFGGGSSSYSSPSSHERDDNGGIHTSTGFGGTRRR
jgi:SOCE-associated regulatory factor of calcium homoeostasis